MISKKITAPVLSCLLLIGLGAVWAAANADKIRAKYETQTRREFSLKKFNNLTRNNEISEESLVAELGYPMIVSSFYYSLILDPADVTARGYTGGAPTLYFKEKNGSMHAYGIRETFPILKIEKSVDFWTALKNAREYAVEQMKKEPEGVYISHEEDWIFSAPRDSDDDNWIAYAHSFMIEKDEE